MPFGAVAPRPDEVLALTAVSRPALRRRAFSIAVALVPFGLAFGVTATEAGLTVAEAAGFSVLVFSGGAQFAAVTVLSDGGSAVAAVAAGLLLNLRLLAFGVVMAPTLAGSPLRRAVLSQLMIDESMAVATLADDPPLRRYGYVAAGLAVFVLWNLSTVVGAAAIPSTGTFIEDWGLDATIPAAFLALLWPRLERAEQRRVALVGAVLAAVLVPLAPPGVPILVAGLGVVAARPELGRR